MESFPAAPPTAGSAPHDGLAYDSSDGYVVFFDSGGASPTTFAYNGSWSQINTSSGPSLAFDYSLADDPADGYLLLLDENFTSSSSETWSYHHGAWTKLHASLAPPPRYGADMTYDSAAHCVLLFGGIRGSGGSNLLNDTWTFANGTWANVTSGPAPTASAFGQLGDDPPDGGAVLFGGDSGPHLAPSNQTWVFSHGGWTKVKSSAAPVMATFDPMAYDPAFGGVLLFGSEPGAVAGSPNETWIFEGNNWVDLQPESVPTQLNSGALAFDPHLFRMVLFDGTSQLLWVFGAGVVSLVPFPVHDGTLEVDGAPGESYSTSVTIDLGFGDHFVTQSAEAWAVFASWNATGNVSLWGAHPPDSWNLTVLGNGTIRVVYTPHPSLTVLDDPSFCYGVYLNGTDYSEGSYTKLFEGNYSAVAPQCPHPPTELVFSHWSAVGALSIADPSALASTVSLRGNATLIAHYLAQLSLDSSPSSYGAIQLNASIYSGSGSIELPLGNYSVVPRPEPWGKFVRWNAGGGLSVQGGVLLVRSTGHLTAVFRFAALVAAEISPQACGSLSLNGTAMSSGNSTQLLPGSYPLAAPDCTGSDELFGGWLSSGGVSVSSPRASQATLTVVGNGTLRATFIPGYTVYFQVRGGEGQSIFLNGTPEPTGGSALLAAGEYALNISPSGSGVVLRSWQTTGSVRVAGGTLYVEGPGTLSALFGASNSTGPIASSAEQWGPYAAGSAAAIAAVLVILLIVRRHRARLLTTTE